jgi:hypothetical protein
MRMGALKLVPVIGKDPLEDTPVPRGLSQLRVAPSWGDDRFAVKRFSHASSASSTPHRPVPKQLSPFSFILESWGVPGPGKCKFLDDQASPARPVQDKPLAVWLIEAALLAQGTDTSVLQTLLQTPTLFPFRIPRLYAADLEGQGRVD